MKELILISGISGAGKTIASNTLEDMGYTCIDQYPAELLPDLIELIKNDQSIKYNKVVLTISLFDLEKFSKLLGNSDLDVKLILIDCDKDTVINRYKFTRRIHPLVMANTAATVQEAVDLEKAVLDKYKKNAKVINTTNLTLKQHREKLNKVLKKDDKNNCTNFHLALRFN